jgi:hypothetical protein
VSRSAVAVLAIAFALAHLPFLAATLDDIDAVNFALGTRDFDVADHRPHPPGYPAYIGVAKAAIALANVFTRESTQSTTEARALSALSLLGAIASIAWLYRVLASISSRGAVHDPVPPPWRLFDARALAATALTASSPLFWYMAVRPMSDMPGLAAALAALACLSLAWWRQQPEASGDRRLTPERMAASGRMIVLGALLTGVAIGFRSQNAMLTLPLLLGVLFDRIGRGVAGAVIGGAITMSLGVLVWALPLVAASGGWNAYLAALGSQAGEDFAGVEMLYLNPTPRVAAFGLLRTLIYPWDSYVLGGVVLSLAAVGAAVLLLRERRALAALTLLSAPYLAFHLLFHDTTFVRYALPVVPAVAFLAVSGVEFMLRKAAVLAVAGLAVWGVVISAPVLAAYGNQQSPVVRALGAMHAAALSAPPGALAMHQTFRRPLQAEDVRIEPVLPSPPRREWLELARYWLHGGTAPVWFLADPRRTDLALIDPRSRQDRSAFAWEWTSLSELGGMRPAAAHWYRLPPPGWFVETGWALTPETAGMSRLMGRGPSIGPITAWVRRRTGPARILIGGRHLGTAGDPPVAFVIDLDGGEVARWQAAPGFFLEQFDLAPGALGGDGLAQLTVRALSGQGGSAATAIEQFDLQSNGTLMWGYDDGWHEAEYSPNLGVWRWTSDRATLRIIGAATPVVISLRVDDPRRYFDVLPTVTVQAGDQTIGETRVADNTFAVTVPADALARANGRVTIATDRTFVPAAGETEDQRRLGLRVFDVVIAPQH